MERKRDNKNGKKRKNNQKIRKETKREYDSKG